MNHIVLVIITALISGLLASLISIWWQRKSETKNRKMRVFETLMAYRYMISAKESVHALNSIDVIFYKDKEVRKAYVNFLDETEKNIDENSKIMDKYLILLEKMAKTLNLKDIHWDDIKHSYYPNGLAQRNQDEEVLMKLQIQNAIDTSNRNQQTNLPEDKRFDQQIIAQVMPELIKNPDSLKMILDMAKKEK